MIKTVLTIEGMSCGMCEAHINETIRRNFDVKKVVSSNRKNTTEIVSESALDEQQLRTVINATGYKLTEICCESYAENKKPVMPATGGEPAGDPPFLS